MPVDRLAGRGAGTRDELCAWGQRPPQMQSDVEAVTGTPYEVPIDQYPTDTLVMGSFVCDKVDQPPLKDDVDWRSQHGLD